MSSRLAATFLATLLVVGCGASSGDASSQTGPSPVVLTDTSPAQLDVSVAINMGGYDVASRDRTLIDVFFLHDGHPVRFVAGERVACGGVAPKRYTGSFEGVFPTSSIAGESLSCFYTSGGVSTPLTFNVPPALVILAPRDHEQVPIGPRTMVRYSGVTENTAWVVALSAKAKAAAQPRDMTLDGARLDTSALGAGEGSISLTDANNFPLTGMQAQQFRSAHGTARRMAMVAVTWVTMSV